MNQRYYMSVKAKDIKGFMILKILKKPRAHIENIDVEGFNKALNQQGDRELKLGNYPLTTRK